MRRLLLLACLLAAPALGQTPNYFSHPDEELHTIDGQKVYTADELKEAATAHYHFKDIYNLGYEGGDSSIRTVDFEASSSQYAQSADSTAAGLNGQGWGFFVWYKPESLPTAAILVSKTVSLAASGEFDFYVNNVGTVFCRAHDGVGIKSDTYPAGVGIGDRVAFHCRYDNSTNELEAGADTTWSGSPTTTAADPGASSIAFTIGAHAAAANPADGLLGPVFFYRGTGEVLTDDITAMLYNGGKGKRCDQLSATEQQNLVACWDWNVETLQFEEKAASNRYVIQKVGGSGWTSAARSVQEFSGTTGCVTYTETGAETERVLFGLDTVYDPSSPTGGTFFDVDFGILVRPSTDTYSIYYKGAFIGSGGVDTWNTGDTASLCFDGSTVKAYYNGVPVWTFVQSADPTPVFVSLTMYLNDWRDSGNFTATFDGSTESQVTWKEPLLAVIGDDLESQNGPVSGPGLVRNGSGDPTLDLTPQNDPQTAGGANGYAASFTRGSSHWATATEDLGSISAKDFMHCGWIRHATTGFNEGFWGQYGATAAERAWLHYRLAGGNLIGVFTDGATSVNTSIGGSPLDNLMNGFAQTYICLYYDVSEKTGWANINNGTLTDSVDAAALGNIDGDGGTYADFEVGRFSAANYPTAIFGEHAFWSATELNFASLIASTFNEGYGKKCSAFTAAEQADLAHCWDMDDEQTVGNTYGDTVDASDLRKVGGAGGTWDAGASSTASISGDGYMEYTVCGSDFFRMAGLSNGDTNQNYTDIDYAAYLQAGDFHIYEGGTSRGVHGTYDLGDTIRVAVEGGVVKYYVEGELRYTSGVAPTYPLLVDSAFASTLTRMCDFTLNGSPVQWQRAVNAAPGAKGLLAQNTPTQFPSLVEQPDSDMGVSVDSGDGSYLSSDSTAFAFTGPFTICGWINPETNAAPQYLARKWTSNYGYFLRYHTNDFINLYYGEAAGFDNATSASAGSVGVWQHICGRYDGSVGYACLNGVCGAAGDAHGLDVSANDFVVGLGADDFSGDAIYIWNFDIGNDGVGKMYADGEGEFY